MPRVFINRGGPFDLIAYPEPSPGWFEEGELIGIDATFLKPEARHRYPEVRPGIDYVYRVQGQALVYQPAETAIRNANNG